MSSELFEKPKEILVRKDSKTDQKFGVLPEERDVDTLIDYGAVNINKPKGPTSHQVSAYVKQILGISKSGHSGTLDPRVTGVLPIALGRATRIVQVLLPAGKEYIALMHLHKEVGEKTLRQALQSFTGEITQLPPLKSAVKRQQRKREIHYLEILEIDGQDVLFRIGCQAGTYIRKLCHDIGKKLGVGAHMSELVRTRVGPIDEGSMFTLQDLRDAVYYYRQEKNEKYIRHILRPVESCLEHLPKVWVFDSAVEALCHGSNLAVPGISRLNKESQKGQTVAILTLKGELVALGNASLDAQQMLGQRGIAVRTHKVFMEAGTYPHITN